MGVSILLDGVDAYIKEEDLKMILSISVFLSVRNQMIIRK